MQHPIRARMDSLRPANEWDFVHALVGIEDEYNCLVEPLISTLANASSCDEVAAVLWRDLEGHSA